MPIEKNIDTSVKNFCCRQSKFKLVVTEACNYKLYNCT